MLGADAVALVHSEQEAEQWMDALIKNPELCERMTLLGQRRVTVPVREFVFAEPAGFHAVVTV